MEENIKSARKANIFSILIGFISFLQIKLFGGILSPFEFLAILFFLWQFTISNQFNINLFKNDVYIAFEKLLIVWSICQIVSDLLNQTIIISSLKGVLTPIFVLLSLRFLLVIYKYFNDKKFIDDFIIGMSLSNLFNLFLISSDLEIFLKMGGIFFIALLTYRFINNIKINFIINIFFLFISFLYGIRSSLIIFLILIFNKLRSKDSMPKKIDFFIIRNVFLGLIKYFSIILILLAISPLSNITNQLIANFYKNEQSLEKIENQSKGNIFAARPEYYSFFDAFKDSPLIGHGSWPIDKDYKYFLISQEGDFSKKNESKRSLIKGSKARSRTPSGYPYMPSHAFIQQNVIWAGFFASLFYLYALNLNLFMISNFNLKYTTSLIFIKYTYDIFFSSLGYNRFYLPFVCLITICYFYKFKKRCQKYK